MLTPKQRAELKAQANPLEPVFQVGKGGVNDAQAAQIEDYLRVHELVKITVLDNSLLSAREAAEDIAGRIGAEVVQCIGSKAVLYKFSEEAEKKRKEKSSGKPAGTAKGNKKFRRKG